ncbi:hypothetical protein DFH08DRAFT_815614 [Mycena albidolilacea]|uniref:Uncharacterized protein n=1 Tax=Mycena albidolilacea TaxID=1033008 RepID=A0AAD6ZM42_9AGAR|nr:hypothetical protein DFH08DRAFT_815614 [Mycena albidolilacea]
MFPFALGISTLLALSAVLANLLVGVGVATTARAAGAMGVVVQARCGVAPYEFLGLHSHLVTHLCQRGDGVRHGAGQTREAGEGAKAGGVVDGWADMASVRLLEACCPMESGHDGESSKQAAELEPRSVIVHWGGKFYAFDRYRVAEDVPGLVRGDLGTKGIAMGSDEFVDVAVHPNGRLEEVTCCVCSTLCVENGEAAEGAHKAYDRVMGQEDRAGWSRMACARGGDSPATSQSTGLGLFSKVGDVPR